MCLRVILRDLLALQVYYCFGVDGPAGSGVGFLSVVLKHRAEGRFQHFHPWLSRVPHLLTCFYNRTGPPPLIPLKTCLKTHVQDHCSQLSNRLRLFMGDPFPLFSPSDFIAPRIYCIRRFSLLVSPLPNAPFAPAKAEKLVAHRVSPEDWGSNRL